MSEYDDYCPDFKIGKCKKDLNCKYLKHIVCKNNYTCNNLDCKLGHGISLIKRHIICNICDNYYDKKYYDNNNEECTYSCNCFIKNCNKKHIIELTNRIIVNNIINAIDDNIAMNIYNKNFNNTNIKLNNNSNELNNNSNKLNNNSNELNNNMLNFKNALTKHINTKKISDLNILNLDNNLLDEVCIINNSDSDSESEIEKKTTNNLINDISENNINFLDIMLKNEEEKKNNLEKIKNIEIELEKLNNIKNEILKKNNELDNSSKIYLNKIQKSL
jgi:X-X-X-Leu-X-X-Gly heptad repeat protein